ncbi:porin [Thiothrix subterranea]|uniref:Porin n=2 Tax=Thiothrix subterranea TaxID=2735563 RepID=A0ABU0YAQ3_9GAMM|nr:porin [Thiothrix subterranea]
MKTLKIALLASGFCMTSSVFAADVVVNDAVSFQLGGKLHVDAGTVDDGTNSQADGQLRRLRLGVSGKWGKDVRTELEYDLSDNTPKLKDAYIEYRGIPHTQVRLGNAKTAVGFENLTSSSDTLFMERALPSALLPGRTTAIQVSQYRDNGSIVVGVAGGTPTTLGEISNSVNEQELLYAHATRLLLNKKHHVLHIGASFARTDPHEQSTRFSTTLESVFGVERLDTGKIKNATSYTTQGVEMAWAKDALLVQGEYLHTTVARDNRPDVNLHGGYVAAAYTVTGEKRRYNSKDAQFEGIQPKRDQGAVELVARVSALDLDSDNISGGSVRGQTLGANYYYNDKVRLMLDYSRMQAAPDKSGDTVTDNILQARLQVSF